MTYEGVGVSVHRHLIADLVYPAWPVIGQVCVKNIVDVSNLQLCEELLDLKCMMFAPSLCPI